MNRRARSLTVTVLLALAFAGMVPERALAIGDPLTEGEIAMIETTARGDFVASALREGLEGEAVDLVFTIERSSAPILVLASTTCPIRVDVDNVTDAPMYGIYFEVAQGFSQSDVPVPGLSDSATHIEIPLVPPRSRVRARVECTEPPSYLAWQSPYAPAVSRSVEFPTFASAHGLESEGITVMSQGYAAFSREYDTFLPGSSIHSLLWHAIDLVDAGAPFDRLLETLLAHPDGRTTVFQYLADVPDSVHGTSIAAAISRLSPEELRAAYSGLPVDVAGRALSLLDERTYERTARVLRTTPEGRAAIVSLLSVTDDATQFAAVAAEIDDSTIDAAIEALAAGSYLESERVALFDQLIVRARALPPERQAALALVLFTRWVDHRVPSFALESRVLATRDMGESEVDALLRARAEGLDDVFLEGALPTELDAMALYQLVANDLSGCGSSSERLRACADLIEGEPALAMSAAAGNLSPDFIFRAQTVLADGLDDGTAALARRYQPWGLSVGPIVERACASASDVYGYAYGSSYRTADYLALAREIDPQAECLRAIDERAAREANERYMQIGLGALLLVLVVGGAVLFGRRGLRRLEAVRREDEKTSPVEDGGRIAQRIAPEPFALALGRGLRSTEAAIREEGAAESEAVVRALAALRPNEKALTEAAQTAVQEVLARGKLHSTLLELGGQSVYLVVVPGMHDQPQAFRRYAAFAHGWLAHVDRLKAMLARSGLPERLLCLFLFVRPDGSETALLVGYEDGTTRYLPFGLLDEEEVHAGAGRQGTHREQWGHEGGGV